MQIQPFAERLAKNTNDCGSTMVVITSDLEICPKLFISYTNKHGLGLIYPYFWEISEEPERPDSKWDVSKSETYIFVNESESEVFKRQSP